MMKDKKNISSIPHMEVSNYSLLFLIWDATNISFDQETSTKTL